MLRPVETSAGWRRHGRTVGTGAGDAEGWGCEKTTAREFYFINTIRTLVRIREKVLCWLHQLDPSS